MQMIESSWLSGSWLQLIYWREPLWLLLTLQPVLLLLLQRFSSQGKLSRYADAGLQAWVSWKPVHKRWFWVSSLSSRKLIYVSAWLLLSISLAGPRLLLEQPAEAGQAEMNIMLVVDVSRSMHTRDIEPDRLRRVQVEINELLQHAANNRFGLIIYTARAHLFVPFTNDLNALRYYLKLIDRIPLPTSGSAPSSALELARKEIDQAHYENKSAILWFTDGDFDDKPSINGALEETVNKLSNTTIPLYILGVGSPEGDAIPLAEGGWLQHQGRPVISRMNEKILTQLADTANGKFIVAQNDDSDWLSLYNQGMAANSYLTSREFNESEVVWHELYQWTLFPAMLFLLASLMPYRLTNTRAGRKALHASLLLLTLCFTLQPYNQARAEEAIAVKTTDIEQQAYNYFLAEKYTLAAELYHLLPGYNGRLGEANSYYRLEQYPRAITQLNQAVLLAESDQRRGIAIYNLANSTFKTGDYSAAATLYRDSLRYRPGHEATEMNLAFSTSLQQMIDEKMQQGMANRMGSGPKSARAQQDLDINNSGSMSFDNEEERKNAEIPLPEIPAEELELLLARGLAHVQLVNKNQEVSSRLEGQKQTIQDITAASLRMRELEDNQQLLWKRLFEMEEGFAASIDKAEPVPGVLPW